MTPKLHPAGCPRLLVSLEEATLAHPFDRKLLVCRRPAEGRELLRALAAAGVAWVGWEPVTIRAIALDAAFPELAAGELSLADEFDVLAAADEAIDAVVERGGAGVLAEGPGARDAIRAALATLRRAGLGAAELRRGDARLEPLAAVLDAYRQALGRMRREDDAGVARRALDALASGAAAFPEARVYLVPGLPLRGVAGRLTRLLIGRGARVLETDPVIGLNAPSGIVWAAGAPASPLSALHAAPPNAVAAPEAEMFAAATPADELREVLRRVAADGAGWDRVEIVAPDAALYGGALESLGRRLEAADEAGVPSTFAEGIDMRRTRVGRALASYFRWIGGGFPADELRRVLDAGDLEAGGVSGAALSRRLRRLRIGWGQTRYLPAIDAALAALPAGAADISDGADDGVEGGAARAREELAALRGLLALVLDATPRGPDRIGARVVRTSVSAVAAGALAFLERVPARTASEAHARAVLRGRLERARETLVRATSWDAAISTLRTRLEIPVAPSAEGGLAPWTAAGGRVHLAGFFTGGLACRAATFVVGLDASAGAAGGGSDPLLSDSDRHLLNQLSPDPVPPLATSQERAAEARHELAALLARLRGRVTLSYAAWDAAEGRASSPAPELLQVVRHREGTGAPGYRELRAALGPLACAVPRAGRLDAADAWLGALAPGGRLRDGRSAVRAAFVGLQRGVAAAEARGGAEATAYHGVVTQNGYAHLPEAFSASALETLGACPRRYFYRYVLRVAPHGDPEWDPESWLTAGERGGLLHRVFERTLREEGAGAPAPEAALAVLEDEASRMALSVPPPSEAVRAAELAELRHDLLCWVEMVREAPPRWVHLEYRFGPGHGEVSIGGIPVALRGVIDRVDRDDEGRLRVVDYKTGKPDRYHPGRPLAAGRRVQHLVYAIAANRLLGGEVDSAEFHFPTRAGRNERVRLPLPPAAEGEALISRMATLAAEGPYLSTEDSGDCAYCDFGAVCRSRPGEYGGATSPPAAWMKATGIHLPEARVFMEMRESDG